MMEEKFGSKNAKRKGEKLWEFISSKSEPLLARSPWSGLTQRRSAAGPHQQSLEERGCDTGC